MTTTPGSSQVSQTLRNVIVGVTTTVLASAIVYFLGFHKTGSSSAEAMFVTKEATIQAWKSYVSAENVFFKNWNLYRASFTPSRFDHFKETTLDELNRFNYDIKKIISTKDLDPTLLSLLERGLRAKENWGDKYKKYLDNYETISRLTADEAERNKKLNDELIRFQSEVKEIDQRFASEIVDLCNTLTAKNNYTFSWTELQMYQPTATNNTSQTNTNARGSAAIDPQMLAGSWKVSDPVSGASVATLYQYENGTMHYYFNTGDSTYGHWQLNNNQLTLRYEQYWGAGQSFIYNVSGQTNNSFTLTFTASPFNSFNLTRAN